MMGYFKSVVWVGVGVGVMSGVAEKGCAQPCFPVEVDKLLASDGEKDDLFGRSVAISGDVAVVGSEQDADLGRNSGAAYIFRFDGTAWVEEAKLLASDGGETDHFGASVSISGDCVVIGAPYHRLPDGEFGAAYVFRFNGRKWVEETALRSFMQRKTDYFGTAVAISGGTIVVGAYWDGVKAGEAGAAYVFSHNGSKWTQATKLYASDAGAFDHFGFSVATSGDKVVIGAPKHDESYYDCGAAYVFGFDGTEWREESELLASDGYMRDKFGQSVSISGDLGTVHK